MAEESRQHPMTPATLYSLALVRAHRGQVGQARELASEALALCERTGNVLVASMALSVLGFVALSLDEHQAAHSHLGRLAEAIAAVGLGEPGVVKFLPDEIEALAALGQVDLAWSLTRQLEAQGKSLGRPWALATAARCRAHLAAADGDLQDAQSACDQALSWHEQLPMPFELARTLLVKGTIERRARRKSAARESLGQALGIFEDLGAPLWADKARRELSTTARAARRGRAHRNRAPRRRPGRRGAHQPGGRRRDVHNGEHRADPCQQHLAQAWRTVPYRTCRAVALRPAGIGASADSPG